MQDILGATPSVYLFPRLPVLYRSEKQLKGTKLPFPAVNKSTYFFRNWKKYQIYINSPPSRHLHHHHYHCRLFQAKTEIQPGSTTRNRLFHEALPWEAPSLGWWFLKEWGFHGLKYIGRGRFHSDIWKVCLKAPVQLFWDVAQSKDIKRCVSMNHRFTKSYHERRAFSVENGT